MPPLQNEFSWSISRARLFEACKRRYFYCYYGSWMGWDFQARPAARLLYRLKQIMTLPMWGGKVVHRTIELALNQMRRGRAVVLETMQEQARRQLNDQWQESEKRLWLTHPKKHVNLFDHYYGRAVSTQQRLELREKVFSSLQGFFELGCAGELARLRPEAYLSVEEMNTLSINDIKVWLVMDCAFRRDGRIVIYDWKTGAPSEHESATDQLICYALFAAQKWSASFEEIEVSLVHLPARKIETHTVAAEQVIDFRERLYASAKEMTSLLSDAKRNVAREEDFPRTGNAWHCRDCEYQEVCLQD